MSARAVETHPSQVLGVETRTHCVPWVLSLPHPDETGKPTELCQAGQTTKAVTAVEIFPGNPSSRLQSSFVVLQIHQCLIHPNIPTVHRFTSKVLEPSISTPECLLGASIVVSV